MTTPAATSPGPLFLDPADQFRHEVYIEWAERIPAEQKAAFPLAPYTLGERFLSSLEAVQGAERTKVVQVVVEILTGLDRELASRDRHVLRAGAAGNAAPVTREDGSVCWRVTLQRNRPSARRLHFWSAPSGIDLSRVVLHDDMKP